MGKSSSIRHVDHKIRKKSFKDRLHGFEKKFYELGTLCGIKAAAVVHSEFINGVIELPKNPNEFEEVVMQYTNIINGKTKMKLCNGEEEEKVNKNFCFGNGSVESLEGILGDLEYILTMISERENQLKRGFSSTSSVYDYGVSSSDFSQQQLTLDHGLTNPTTTDDDMFADTIELEFQRLNCSSSYMEMIMNANNPPELFL
ncbi:hypothetical protein MKX01_010261, partial [Papaver californicum]